jgi:hypothetical protein
MNWFREIVLICAAIIFAGLVACQNHQASETGLCSEETIALLIGESAFPEQWRGHEPTSDDEFGQGAIQKCVKEFTGADSSAYEEIYKYPTTQNAIDDYAQLVDLFSWEESDQFPAPTLQSEVADDLTVQCAIAYNYHQAMCGIVARYDVYIVHFNTHLAYNVMTTDDLAQVLEAIDDKMRNVIE